MIRKIGNVFFVVAHPFFWKCDKINTKDGRIDILKKDFPDNCISCGFRHQTQSCDFRSACNQPDCVTANGNHNKLTCPNLLTAPVVGCSQISFVPHLISALNTDGKSVALPTAIYTVLNSKAQNLPLEQRNVAVLVDSAAQRTLYTRAIAEKFGA